MQDLLTAFMAVRISPLGRIRTRNGRRLPNWATIPKGNIFFDVGIARMSTEANLKDPHILGGNLVETWWRREKRDGISS